MSLGIIAGSKWRGGRVAEGAPLLREYTVYPVSRVRIPPPPPSRSKPDPTRIATKMIEA